MRPLSLLALLALLACQDKVEPVDSEPSVADDSAVDSAGPVDADGDGYAAEDDCDDADPSVNPGATEACNGVDDNCDGEVDEGLGLTTYADADGDGWGDDESAAWACELGEGQAEQGGDCDDGDAAYNPGAVEDDCTDPNDYNCDGQVGYADEDGDGYAACEECDDSDAAVNPGATEVCNGQDDDCDGLIDDADEGLDASTASTWYTDSDGDGYGDAALQACTQPSGTSATDGDCDDGDAATYPGATELCDGADNDCDGYDDTLGYWSFEAGAGSTAFDASAWGHDGVITGASWTSSGYQGGALDFDGSNDDVELPYSTLEPTDGFTISAWVNPDSLRASSWDSIVSRGSTGTTTELGCCADPYYVGYYRYEMSFYTDSTATLGGIVDGGSYSGHIGSWHHVLVTADYSSGARVIYVDGAQTATDANAPSTPIFDGAPTRFGADTNSGSAVLPFDGRIDEIKIFDCAVTASEAAADFSSGWPF